MAPVREYLTAHNCQNLKKKIFTCPGRYIFSVVNIYIELSLYAVAVRFLDYRFFLL